jgi:hypothetical protein
VQPDGDTEGIPPAVVGGGAGDNGEKLAREERLAKKLPTARKRTAAFGA